MTINKDTVSGKVKEVKGQIREKWGQVTNDAGSVIQGNAEQVAGKAQQGYGNAKENLKEGVINTIEKAKEITRPDQTPDELPPVRPEPSVVDPQARR